MEYNMECKKIKKNNSFEQFHLSPRTVCKEYQKSIIKK